MKAQVNIDAGVCGFMATACAISKDGQNVTFDITTNCEKIRLLGQALQGKEPIDAYQEISPGGSAVIMTTVKDTLTGCCAGCAVPVGLFKGMQVAANLALPKDINIKITKEN
jgi:hypothetical protein